VARATWACWPGACLTQACWTCGYWTWAARRWHAERLLAGRGVERHNERHNERAGWMRATWAFWTWARGPRGHAGLERPGRGRAGHWRGLGIQVVVSLLLWASSYCRFVMTIFLLFFSVGHSCCSLAGHHVPG
jgi:hypothetical protein